MNQPNDKPDTNPSSPVSERGDEMSTLDKLLQPVRVAVRERPLTIVSGAAALGFIAGSLSPKFVARPLGILTLRAMLSRMVGGKLPSMT